MRILWTHAGLHGMGYWEQGCKVLHQRCGSQQRRCRSQGCAAVVDQKADAVIVPRIGKNASDVLDLAGIKIYKSKTSDIMENIHGLEAGELEILTDIHPGFHNH